MCAFGAHFARGHLYPLRSGGACLQDQDGVISVCERYAGRRSGRDGDRMAVRAPLTLLVYVRATH